MSDSPALSFFKRLAARGHLSGASSGEKAAYRLAVLFREEGIVLDGQAFSGLWEFFVWARSEPMEAGEWLEGLTAKQSK